MLAMALLSPTEHGTEADDDGEEGHVTVNSEPSRPVGRPKKKQKTTGVTTRALASIPEGKAMRVNDRTLCPVNGGLRCRLNSKVSHLPDDDVEKLRSKTLRCALHRWYKRDLQYKKNVMVCVTCRVALCPWCYRIFQEEEEVEALRAHVKKVVYGK